MLLTGGWTLEMLRGASKPWSCDGGLAKAYHGTAKCFLLGFETDANCFLVGFVTDGWTLEMPKRGVGGTWALAHSTFCV